MQIFRCTSFFVCLNTNHVRSTYNYKKNKIRHLVKYLHCIFLNNLFLFHVTSMANITGLVYLECVSSLSIGIFSGQRDRSVYSLICS